MMLPMDRKVLKAFTTASNGSTTIPPGPSRATTTPGTSEGAGRFHRFLPERRERREEKNWRRGICTWQGGTGVDSLHDRADPPSLHDHCLLLLRLSILPTLTRARRRA